MKFPLLRGLLLTALLCAAWTSANAAWKCQMHNAKGQTWYGTGPTRSAAAANAMRFCSNNSRYAKNCVVDSCALYP